jgi:putative hydrolase of the HAD superfamily
VKQPVSSARRGSSTGEPAARPVLVFDLDDTLYPELDFVHGGFRAVAALLEERWGLTAGNVRAGEIYSELVECFSGPGSRPFDTWLAARGLHREALLEPMLVAYREHRPLLRLYADAGWALRHFGCSHRLALLTDGRSSSQRNKIEALGLAPLFEYIQVSDETGLGPGGRKPSSLGFSLLLERMSVPAARAVYVADNPAKDFAGARRVGMLTVRVRRPCGLYSGTVAPEPSYAPDADITTLFGLAALLPGLLLRPRRAAPS